MQAIQPFVLKALASARVGTWEVDVARERAICDAMAATLFGFDPAEAAAGLPIRTFDQFIHPDDRADYAARVEGNRDGCEFAVIEHRTVPRPGDVRWLQMRGRYERDPVSDTVIGRGIVIDITDGKRAGMNENGAFSTVPDTGAFETPLERAAGHAIQVREALDACDEREAGPLRRSVDALLWAIGRALARHIANQRR